MHLSKEELDEKFINLSKPKRLKEKYAKAPDRSAPFMTLLNEGYEDVIDIPGSNKYHL